MSVLQTEEEAIYIANNTTSGLAGNWITTTCSNTLFPSIKSHLLIK